MRKLIKIIAGLLFLANIGLNAQVTVVNDGILTVKDSQLVYINGSLSNYSSQFLNQGDIGLTGNLLNEVRVTNPGLGIFRFIGFQPQTVTLFDTLDMFNVEVDNPDGLSFDGLTNLRVFGNMNFWDGIVETNSDQMVSFQQGATTSNGNTFSHINGPALKTGANDFVFPVGKEGDYRPASILDMENSSVYLMEYTHYPYFNYTREYDILEVNEEGFWDLKRLKGSANPKLGLTYDASTNLFDNPGALEIVHWENIWKIIPSEPDSASLVIGLTTHNRVTNYGFFTTAERRVAIPDLSSMSISQNEFCEIILDWTMPPGTLAETYEIEYSYDSLDFIYTGEIQGNPEMLTEYLNYQYIDKNLHEVTKVYYRIKIIAPGPWPPFAYSPTISIDNECIYEDCKIFPNPLSSKENLKFQVNSEVATEMPLKVWDAVGRLMFDQTLLLEEGPNIYEINTKENSLISGTYFLSINPKKSLKFIVISE
jgi:hypothetical protein